MARDDNTEHNIISHLIEDILRHLIRAIVMYVDFDI